MVSSTAHVNGHGPYTNGVTNGHSASTTSRSRPLKAGIYAPIPAFFKPDSEDLDISAFQTHVLRIAKAGVGLVISGTMGEAHHLLHDERVTLIKSARRALDDAGLTEVPIIAGTGAGSLRETIILTKEAAAAGADYSIVITSGYFAGALDKSALVAFYTEVAQKSPIPVIIYNYPGAAGGIDLDSDTILQIAKVSPNIVGVKLTCGNVGKLTRIAASSPFLSARSSPAVEEFLVLGGFTDFIVPSAFADGHGAITGLANVVPHACAKLFKMAEQLKATLRDPSLKSDPNLLSEAIRLQGIIANADRMMALGSISGTKAVIERLCGYGGRPRKPLPPISHEAAEALWSHPSIVDALREEKLAEAKST